MAGEDSDYGLPGVSYIQRIEQPPININKQTLLSALPGPVNAVAKSKWNTRAWTYQEFYYSNQRLFFTYNQVYFECQTVSCSESIARPLQKSHEPKLTDFPIHNVIRSRTISAEHYMAWTIRKMFPYREIISKMPETIAFLEHNTRQYTSREYTYDTDSLNAFRNILQEVSLHNLQTIWGLPFLLRQPEDPLVPCY